ncbi:GNAT family N-acetyltransferase [Massilia sp. GCM10023247]|uniref:GNAT family N-acetyltransferase n=1 Tax=Massilia sp. GCM10023247 TaxID=3252643 RepID=UPI003608417C
MNASSQVIRPVAREDLPALFVYLDDHLRDNGRNGMPLFQPMARAESFFPVERRASFVTGMLAPVGEPGWRRSWMALDAHGYICGHVDLRARPERAARHRCLLGMGVHRDHRRHGLGARLLDTALGWARAQPGIDWVDLEVMSNNLPARRLYERSGFAFAGEIPDLFRIDGEQYGYVFMNHRL